MNDIGEKVCKEYAKIIDPEYIAYFNEPHKTIRIKTLFSDNIVKDMSIVEAAKYALWFDTSGRAAYIGHVCRERSRDFGVYVYVYGGYDDGDDIGTAIMLRIEIHVEGE